MALTQNRGKFLIASAGSLMETRLDLRRRDRALTERNPHAGRRNRRCRMFEFPQGPAARRREGMLEETAS
jgi:hypothetical protein